MHEKITQRQANAIVRLIFRVGLGCAEQTYSLYVEGITGQDAKRYLAKHSAEWTSGFKLTPDDANNDAIYCREVREILSR